MKIVNQLINFKSKNKIFFLPLGGAGEIGMNLNMYCYQNEWLIVDCGVTFKDHEAIGADVFMPNIDVIVQNSLNIKGLLITHAHEDHIGAVHHLWPFLKCPIYLTPFSAYLLKQRLIDAGLNEQVKLNVVKKESKFNIGKFNLELINMSHSTLEPNSVLITMGKERIFHTGDWKIDKNPTVGNETNTKRLKEIGKEGIRAIVCDSTNANVNGYSGSEKSVENGIAKYIKNFKGRIFITMFASNLERMLAIMRLASLYKREVGLIGRSMWRMCDAARNVGYLNTSVKISSEKFLRNIKDEKFLSICTGSQGEPLGALNRIIDENHPHINFKNGDRIIFSSRKIPGNEVSIGNLMNKLIDKGIEIILPQENNIHVSGHPARDELKLMYSWIKPEISIPVHGEALQIKAHAELAENSGVKNVLKIKNGHLVEFSNKQVKIVEKVDSGKLALNGDELIPTNSLLFKERKRMLFNGVVSINLIIGETGDTIELPRIKFLAVLFELKEKELFEFSSFLNEQIKGFIPIKRSKEQLLKDHLKKKAKRYLLNNFEKNPSIILDIIYIAD
ncbi:MAG: hypothetical protein CMP24_01515 [Rickettsiales bacterium]|nr:hypothetical protein [Rickettsiales bacterium]